MAQNKALLGTYLLEKALVTEQQLANALAVQQTKGGFLGQILVESGYLTEAQVHSALAEQFHTAFVNLKSYSINQEISQQLPENHARRYRAIVLADEKTHLLIGMVDPQDLMAFDGLSQILKRQLKVALVGEMDLLNAFNVVYRRTREIAGFAEELSEELGRTDFDLAQLSRETATSDAPVVKLLQSIMEDAVQIRASDIHIEPEEKVLRIRQRVDGVLQEHVMKEVRAASALTQRFKLMAGLNIAERRLPQDGRFSIKIKDRNLDIRLSTLPVQFGESVVMRLLDNAAVAPEIEQLDLPDAELALLKATIQMPHGLLLVTGPTGSGKTTTLYSILGKLNRVDRKIITVEDPIEYRMPRVNQVQINAAIDLTFATVLRSVLRQDPDVIMIGEIRDKETSAIALRAAMTGHLVLSTMHTNDALSSAIRMMDMGCEGYLIASAVTMIIAQRLMRRICVNCKEELTASAEEIEKIKSILPELAEFKFHYGRGCSTCNNTGYKGRVGIVEMLKFDSAMQQTLAQNDTIGFIKAAHAQKYTTLAQAAMQRVLAGISTLSEVWRVAI